MLSSEGRLKEETLLHCLHLSFIISSGQSSGYLGTNVVGAGLLP